MNYKALIIDVAARSGLHTDIVLRVLYHLPDALTQMEIGDDVRTPLGVFRMTHSPERPIILPDQSSTAVVASKTLVKLKPGGRLRIGASPDEG